MNMDVLSYHTVLFVALSCMNPFISICTELGTLTNTSYLWHAFLSFSLTTHTDSSLCHAFFPPSPVFHFAMECFMCRVKKSSRVEQCRSAAPWPAPHPNLILAVLKIVRIPRPNWQASVSSLCCPRSWKRPLCTNSTALFCHEIFTG